MKILFVNPSRPNCGIHQFGKRVYNSLKYNLRDFGDYDIAYVEGYDNKDQVLSFSLGVNPDVILWSFNPTALPLAVKDGAINVRDFSWVSTKHIAVCHEQEQVMVDHPERNDWHWFGSPGFDAWIGHDPTLVIPEGRDNIFRAARPVLRSEWKQTPVANSAPYVFGNSTFGFHNKGHVRICRAIAEEFEEATIRFNMPPSEYGDPDLKQAREVEVLCRNFLQGYPRIKLEVTHEMFETEQSLLDFLYGNDVNIFDYDQGRVPEDMRGVASSPDTALSTRRPLIVTGCTMFRHLHPLFGRYPEDGTITQLIGRQLSCNVPDFVYNEWTPARMTADYVRVINKVMAKL